MPASWRNWTGVEYLDPRLDAERTARENEAAARAEKAARQLELEESVAATEREFQQAIAAERARRVARSGGPDVLGFAKELRSAIQLAIANRGRTS